MSASILHDIQEPELALLFADWGVTARLCLTTWSNDPETGHQVAERTAREVQVLLSPLLREPVAELARQAAVLEQRFLVRSADLPNGLEVESVQFEWENRHWTPVRMTLSPISGLTLFETLAAPVPTC